jgi:predicted MPP superfamily phosphohydrolase
VLARIVGGALLATAAGAVYSIGIAPRWLRVTRLRIALPGLPAAWDGLRIAQLADFHANGPRVSDDFLAHAKQTALDFAPDLVAITGDFFEDGQWSEKGELYRAWPAGVPVLAVLGNHDYRGGPINRDLLLAQLQETGIALLRNAATTIILRGCPAWVAGTDDPHSGRHDVTQTLGNVPDCEDVLLLLAHSPAVVTELPFGRVRLMLSGHTHGGQVRLLPSGQVPFVNLLRALRNLPRRTDPPFFRGWGWVRGTVLVISDGLGVSTLPIRFRTRPQVILIELAAAGCPAAPCDDGDRYVTDLSEEPRWLRWLT